MGDSHIRANLLEYTSGQRIQFTNATFTTATVTTLTAGTLTTSGTITGTGAVAAANVRATSYFRLGTNVYIIKAVGAGIPSAFSSAVLNQLATSTIGATTAAAVGKGSMILTASGGSAPHVASTCFIKAAPLATWCNVSLGAAV